jgi:hypothetical protein
MSMRARFHPVPSEISHSAPAASEAVGSTSQAEATAPRAQAPAEGKQTQTAQGRLSR